MFRPCRSERYRLQTIDRAIQLVEDHMTRMEALSATLAAVGRDEDAAYARALLRLGRSYLDLLCRSRHWLLSRERPRGEGWATTEAALLNTLLRPLSSTPSDAGVQRNRIEPDRVHSRRAKLAAISTGPRLSKAV